VSAGATLPEPPPAARLREIGIRGDEIRVVEQSELWSRVHRTDG
jgi:hypothetical protein